MRALAAAAALAVGVLVLLGAVKAFELINGEPGDVYDDEPMEVPSVQRTRKTWHDA